VTLRVDAGILVDIFYFDFAKALDKGPREWLLMKLKAAWLGEELAYR